MDVTHSPLSKKVKLESLKTVTDSNLLCFSEDFSNSKWGNYLGTKKLSATNILNPFGTSTVSSISGAASISQDTEKFNAFNSVGQYTFSIYVNVSSNPASGTITPTIWTLNPISRAAGCSFNVKTGKALSTIGTMPLDSYHSEYKGNGWYRYFITTTQSSAIDTSLRCEVYYNSTAPLTGNIIAWGAQLEKGKNYGTYLKTKSFPEASVIEHDFVSLKKAEPSLGLPFIKNHLTYSQTFSSWKSYNISLSGDYISTLSPNSAYNAYKLIPNTTTTTHYITNTARVIDVGIPYTYSTFFKASAYRYATLKISSLEDSGDTYISATADISAGNIMSSLNSANVNDKIVKITPYYNNWYRLSITGTLSTFKNFLCEIYAGAFATANVTFNGNNSSYIFVWGSQLEKGDKDSKYVNTNSQTRTGISYSDIYSSTELTSAYYFPIMAKSNEKASIKNSRRFTGSETLFLSGKYLSYNCNNPKYNFDIWGTFHALSAYMETLSTNNFTGTDLFFEDFKYVNVDTEFKSNKTIAQWISANYVFVTGLTALSTRYDYLSVPSICANYVFSNITWNVTANNVSAYNITPKYELISPYVSATRSFFHTLSVDNLTIYTNLTSLCSLSAVKIHGQLNLDPTSLLYYNDDGVLNTRLSATYFFGVKPSDSYSTDNASVYRSLTGVWDGGNGSVVETLPVSKPYFKNIRQVFDYVAIQKLYGETLNILIYDDIVQDNVKSDGSSSVAGCTYSGNVAIRYYGKTYLPTFMQQNGFRDGDYVWLKDTNADWSGSATYWTVDRLNFKNLNITGMYEIGTVINSNGKTQYTYEKPFNYSPRKISFRTYICTDAILGEGNFGSDANAWKSMYTKPSNKFYVRPVYFNGDEMDVNIQNVCFEFENNANDSTCLFFQTGNSYLTNVTVAALGSGYYAYGAIYQSPKSFLYICGTNQIDPYLLTSTTWNQWSALNGAYDQNYYPGYGIAIVGNSTIDNKFPTLFGTSFFTTFRSNLYIMDYNTNRRVGRSSFHNASIILDGSFSATSFYELQEKSKIYANNHVFRTNNFALSNYDANVFTNGMSNGKYLNEFQNTNRNNFYYVDFKENFSTFVPHYFQIINWEFKDSVIQSLYPSDRTIFTSKFTSSNDNYIFNENTRTICLTGSLNGIYKKNVLREAWPLNDNQYFYDYIDPNDLPLYNTNGIFKLTSPINNTSIYTLNFYSSGGQTINV